MKKVFLSFFIFAFILFGCTAKEDNKKNVYALGDYGDYVGYVDEKKSADTLEEEYQKLCQKKIEKADDIFQSEYEVGLLKLFSIDEKIKLIIDISKEELNKLNEDYKTGNKESYRICNLDIVLGEFIFHYEQVGIRQKGNTSRGAILDDEGKINLRHYKLSFAETFDDEFTSTPLEWEDNDAKEYRENRNFFGIEKLNIRWNRNQDSTYLREYYAFEMYRANGVLAPHTAPMQVEMKIGDTIENLGVYLAVEDIDKSFIKRNVIKAQAGGDLYKMGWTNVGATLDHLDSNLFGVEYQIKENQGFKQIGYPYDLKTNKKTSKHELIQAFIQKIISTEVSLFDSFLKTDMLYDYTINYLAVSYLLGDPDDLRGNSNNTYLYFLKDTKQAIFIPTDHDRALGSTGGGGNPTNHHGALNQPFDDTTGYAKNETAFFQKSILEFGNLNIKQDYLEAISSVLSKHWLDINTFTSYYDKAKENYSTVVALGEKVNGKKVDISLQEKEEVSDSWNLSIETYFKKKTEAFTTFTWDKEEVSKYTEFYLRGEMNNWNGITGKYCLKLVDDVPTLLVYLDKNQQFKIADSSWNQEFNFSDLLENSLFHSVGNNQNISPKEAGTYKIEIVDYHTDHPSLLITKQ